MKNLYMIGGTMGVGKTTVSQILKKQLENAVFLDGDWCWDADPFCVTEETKKMVLKNICFLLTSFLNCSAYKNVIFCWVMHEQSILNEILSNLPLENVNVKSISLTADEEALTERLMKDIKEGKRLYDILERSKARLPLYASLDTIKIDTSLKAASEIAEEIALL